MNILAVGVGGFIGAVLRYLIGKIPVSEYAILSMVVGCAVIFGAEMLTGK